MKRIHVVAAVIRRGDDILLAQRLAQAHQGGLWEFPGGKVEAGEEPSQALIRELDEELGIQASNPRPFMQLRHEYPDKSIFLDIWQVHEFTGEPEGREGQQVRWVPRSQLKDYVFPAANTPIVNKLVLPPFYVLSPDFTPENALVQYRQWWQQLWRQHQQRPQDYGLWVFRAPQLPVAMYRQLAKEFLATSEASTLKMLVHGDGEHLLHLPQAAGVHLTEAALFRCQERLVAGAQICVAATHSAEALAHAQKIACDAVTLSPVQRTQTHPNQQALGWAKFSELIRDYPLPVYALGGLAVADLAVAQQHGAHGVAGISAIFS